MKKKLPEVAWKDIKKIRMKIRTRSGLSMRFTKRETKVILMVQHAVPPTRIVFKLNFEPKRGAMHTPMI